MKIAGTRCLTQVREARGAKRTINAATAEELMDEIIMDARKDLICEGQTFFLYKRLNLPTVPSASRPGTEKPMEAGYVLPIPTSESPF